ncbi:MAG: hypothetical protein WKF77_05320 [Planctomycetaceae bacterium]
MNSRIDSETTDSGTDAESGSGSASFSLPLTVTDMEYSTSSFSLTWEDALDVESGEWGLADARGYTLSTAGAKQGYDGTGSFSAGDMTGTIHVDGYSKYDIESGMRLEDVNGSIDAVAGVGAFGTSEDSNSSMGGGMDLSVDILR